MRICVAAICKNEEKNIQQWLEHVSAADAISIVDTGSEDRTSEIISDFDHPSLYHSYDIAPDRHLGFSRNLAATPFSEDDLVVWLDIDERFDDPNWVETLRATESLDRAEAVWVLMRNGDSHYKQMKAYRPRSYSWMYRAHEVLVSRMPDAPQSTVEASFATDHFPDSTKSRSYLLELGRDVGDYPREDRCSFYYARELCYAVIYDGRSDLLDDARQEVARLATIARWSDYVTLSHIELSKALYKQGFVEESVSACYKAIASRTDRIEPYALLSDIYYRKGDNINAIGFALSGISAATNCTKSFLFDQTSINLDLCYETAYWGCRNLGLIEPALNYLAHLATLRGQNVEEQIKASGLLDSLQSALQENTNAQSKTDQEDSN